MAASAGGGKFANGAVSAAFSHLFNAETSSEQNDDPSASDSLGWGKKALLAIKKWFDVGSTSRMTVGVGGVVAGEVANTGAALLNPDMASVVMRGLTDKAFDLCLDAGRCNFVEDYSAFNSARSNFGTFVDFFESRGHFGVMRNDNGGIVKYWTIEER
jgi:hypothetical protein